MLTAPYTEHIQALRYAALEAYLTLNGEVNSTDLVRVFGMHRCNAAKIINRYIIEENLDVTYDASAKVYRTLPEYQNKVLKSDANAVMYLKMLFAVHGKEFKHEEN